MLSIAASLALAPSALAQAPATGGSDTTDPSTAVPPVTTTVPATPATGGVAYGAPADSTPPQLTPGQTATVDPATGQATVPQDAPPQVQAAIIAANQIIGRPYVYGGGHNLKFLGSGRGKGYDCSGTVSFALHGANLLDTPLDSSSFMKWGQKGPGTWFTVYTNPGHAFMVIAGLRLDTSAAGDPGGLKGPRWRPVLRSTKGFSVRHPVGF